MKWSAPLSLVGAVASFSLGFAGAPEAQPQTPDSVDLGLHEEAAVATQTGGHVLANPWWQNFDVHGFGAAGYYDTNDAGTRPHGTFEIKEASLFVEGAVWQNIAFFIELQTNRLGKDQDKFARTGEVYLNVRDLVAVGDWALGMKVGRIDIPFGEEYLWQDAIDNPLITNSAAYVYGFDEGVLVYSRFRDWNWLISVTDGTDVRSFEDDPEKAWNLKLYGDAAERLHLSFSAMKNGDSAESAIEFGGSHLQPVGASHFSTLGASSSATVDAELGEFDFRYEIARVAGNTAYVSLSVGAASVDDRDPNFDRTLRWFAVESYFSWRGLWYLIARYSQIGTGSHTEGFHFDGKIFAGGNAAFGYDARRFDRLGLGLGWTPNPNLRAKVEVGRDRFDLLDASTLPRTRDDRRFLGVELAAKF